MNLLRVLLGFLLMMALPAVAIEPFVIKDIRIEGLQRTEAGTVFSYLPVKVGDTMTDEKAAQAIRALFATGFFRDVTLEVDRGVLVVVVQERPSVAQIDFVGMREFEKDVVIKALRQVGLAEGRIFDKGLLDRAEQELKRQYLSRGMYAVSISTTVTPLERNRVSINFSVDEGAVSKIRQITIIGANVFRERELVGLFNLRTPGLLTWFSKQDQYSRQKLSADLETLRSHYLDRGYLEFSIESTQVSITPDKQDIYITVIISEGPKYTVSGVKIDGVRLIPDEEIRKLIKIKPGETFSRATLTESTKAISDRLGNDGYAFANVNAIPELDKKKRQVAFTFFVDPGRRVYVRRINVSGNNRTRDEVIRREMRQLEGGWYSGEKINLSRQRIDKLGYFTEVNVETPAVQGATDQVDVNVSVVEKPTGLFLIGAGFGSGSGVLLSGSISQENIFGSGKHVSAVANASNYSKVYSLSYTDPYFTLDGVSQGFDLYHRTLDGLEAGLGIYRTKTTGAAVRLGVPVSELDTINYGLGYEVTKIETFPGDPLLGIPPSPLIYTDYVATFGERNTAVLGTIGWARDGRDSLIYPTSGSYHKVGGEVGLPGGSLKYYKTSYNYQRYFPLTRLYTLMVNGEVGYGEGYGGKPLPFFRNFYAGGVTSVRGYRQFTIGPKDSELNPRGGSRKLLGNVEFLFPFPGLEGDRSVRMSAFVDSGMVADSYKFSELRYSTGLAVLWVSPLGPLKVSAALPIGAKDGDRRQPFQFTIGGVFQ
jgi:outer membrane protein insertion porin family